MIMTVNTSVLVLPTKRGHYCQEHQTCEDPRAFPRTFCCPQKDDLTSSY